MTQMYLSLKGDRIMGRGFRLGFYKILMGIRSNFIIILVKMALICSSELMVSFILILSSSLPFINIVIESLFIYFLVCQEVPEEPVLSTVSNHVFERRLILKYLQENGTDPINGEPLEETQLLEIKCKL